MPQSAEPFDEGDRLRELERRLTEPQSATRLGDSVVRQLRRWNGRWYSEQEKQALSRSARGAMFEVLEVMKMHAALGTKVFDDLVSAEAHLVIRAAALLHKEGCPREIPDADRLDSWAGILAVVPSDEAMVDSERCPEALGHALKSSSGGATMEHIVQELHAYFGIHITPACLAVQIAIAIRYFVAEKPDSSAAKRLRKVRNVARDLLVPHLTEYYRSSGLNDLSVRIAVGMALCESNTDTAAEVGMKPTTLRTRRARLRKSSSAVANTFPVKPLSPDLGVWLSTR